jgi:hypothetical protein
MGLSKKFRVAKNEHTQLYLKVVNICNTASVLRSSVFVNTNRKRSMDFAKIH